MKKIIIIVIFIMLGMFLLNAKTRIGELPQLLKPNSISVDEQRCYITDGTSVLIYSLENFKLLKKFGKQGEGPREFKKTGYGIKTTIYDDFLVVHSQGRESFFKKNGDFIKEENSSSMIIGLKPMGKKFVAQKLVVDREKKSFDFAIILCNSAIEQEKDLHRYKHPFFGQKKINPLSIRGNSFRIYKEKLFIDDKDGRIKVFDISGQALETIQFPYKKEKISAEDKEKILKHWKYSVLSAEYKRYKNRTIFPDYFPHMRDFHVLDGKIYVITYRENTGDSELIILTTNGKLLKRIWVPLADTNMFLPQLFNFYTINNGNLYRVVQNKETDDWELHINIIDES